MGSNGARYLPQLGSPYNYQLALKNVVIMVTLVCDGGYEVGTLMLFSECDNSLLVGGRARPRADNSTLMEIATSTPVSVCVGCVNDPLKLSFGKPPRRK